MKDEDAIHPLAKAVLKQVEDCCGDGSMNFANAPWIDAGCPLLTDEAKAAIKDYEDRKAARDGRCERPTFDKLLDALEEKERKLQETKATLEAVEEAMKICDECYNKTPVGICVLAYMDCPLAPIRRAAKGEKP